MVKASSSPPTLSTASRLGSTPMRLGDGNDGPMLGGGHLTVAAGATAVAIAGLVTGSLGRAVAPGSRPCRRRRAGLLVKGGAGLGVQGGDLSLEFVGPGLLLQNRGYCHVLRLTPVLWKSLEALRLRPTFTLKGITGSFRCGGKWKPPPGMGRRGSVKQLILYARKKRRGFRLDLAQAWRGVWSGASDPTICRARDHRPG